MKDGCSCLKKRTEKLLCPGRAPGGESATARQKFFASFFQKSSFFLLLVLALSACGKVGAPSPPGPADQITYPKSYPNH